jgi:rhodanese-related sulfurtransferase
MPHSPRFEQLVNDVKSRVKELSPSEARDRQAAGAVGATHLSRGVLELKIEQAAPDLATPIICYCGGGSRSALAAESLQKMGYTNVASLETGFRGWQQAGLPTE